MGSPAFDNIFWLTIGVIFTVTLLTAFIKRLSKDRCLALLGKYHTTYLGAGRPTAWGRLFVSSQGVELLFDAPVSNERAIVKASALVFEDEYPTCIAFCRNHHSLTPKEREARAHQVRVTFAPPLWRRTSRWLRNALNTLHDAITRSLSLVVGRFAGSAGAASGIGVAMKSQQDQFEKVGGSAVALAANAYEPLLERYVGREVVLEILSAPGHQPEVSSFPGYLVDYSPQFIAVFNMEDRSVECVELGLDAEQKLGWVTVTPANGLARVQCAGEDAVIVRSLRDGERVQSLGVTLLPGSSVQFPAQANEKVVLERSRCVDIVAPRSRARVRFGGLSGPRRAEASSIVRA